MFFSLLVFIKSYSTSFDSVYTPSDLSALNIKKLKNYPHTIITTEAYSNKTKQLFNCSLHFLLKLIVNRHDKHSGQPGKYKFPKSFKLNH